MPDEPLTFWARVKSWLYTLVSWNAKKYAIYLFAVLIPTLIGNCGNPNPAPIPPPPEPEIPLFPDAPFGWVPPAPEDTAKTLLILQTPRFGDTDAANAVLVAGEDYPLWRLATKGRGAVIPVRDQGAVGSCVSFGFAAAVEYTMAAQVVAGKKRQDLPDICQEAIYAGSRVEVNGGSVPFGGDGSTGAWGAKWLSKVGGALPRGVYGSLDLTAYDVSRCKQWGNRGVPDELEPLARKHPAVCTLVDNVADAKKSLAQGYAISVCSDVGFGDLGASAITRDGEGFLRASGYWPHCMAVIGYRADRPGFLILNSWGERWVAGPVGKYSDTPAGSFWADEATVARMLKQGDSYAVANPDGFKRRKILPEDWTVQRNPEPRWINGVFALAP